MGMSPFRSLGRLGCSLTTTREAEVEYRIPSEFLGVQIGVSSSTRSLRYQVSLWSVGGCGLWVGCSQV